MLASYFRLTIRLYKAQRLFFLINLFGLITGAAAFMMIMIYVNHERSYDKFHQNADRIFRVYNKMQWQGIESTSAQTPAPLAEFLSSRYHDVVSTVRIIKPDRSILSTGGQYFYEDRLILADPSFLKVFDFPLLAGDTKTALRDPNSIIITQSMAEKYFGDADPLGKGIRIDYNGRADLTVTGVLRDVPANSHFHFDFLAPIDLYDIIIQTGLLEDKISTIVYTYLYLNDSQGEILPGLEEISKEYLDDPFLQRGFAVQPIKSIHLHSNHFGEFEKNSSIEFIQILTTIAFAILMMAMFNFINLSTALYQKRLPKIGMLKTIGSSQGQLIQMFCMESLLIVLFAIGVSTLLVAILLPYFGILVDRSLAFPIKDAWFIPGTLSLVALLAILAASYPSLFISGQKPYTLLRGQSQTTGGIKLKNTLVVCQFAVSVILLVATIAMRQQMDYIQNRDLGFSREALLVLPVADRSARLHTERIKDELLKQSPVLSATASSDLPGAMKFVTSIYYNGLPANQTNPTMAFLYVDQDFLPTFDIELIEGRNFSGPGGVDQPREFIINEAAVRLLGWQDPVGMEFGTRDGMGTVVGVMKDFHFKSVHSKIEPLFLSRSSALSYVFLRVRSGNFQQTLDVVEKAWIKVLPETPFDYFFYDTFFEQLYRSEKQFETIALISAVVSILITCFGLFGLTAYSTQQRRKEMAIRKVFGASISDILVMLSGSFLRIFSISMIIAIPVSLYIVDRWLGTFEYHVEVKWWLFLASGMILVIISLLVISQQSISAAKTNPVKWISHNQ